MEYGTIPDIDKPISRLVQGTMMLTEERIEHGFDLLEGVYELGCTTFDTAHVYAGGQAERVLGRWMDARGLRDKVVILTKGAHHNADRRRVTSFDIASDIHDSLARLRTDHIDLYVLHRDDPEQPIGPIVEALNEHHDAGRIGAFGGSNWSHERLREGNEYAQANGLISFAVSSPNFSLAVPTEPIWEGCVSIAGPDAADPRAWYAEAGIPVFTWSSLARGFLSGQFSRQTFASPDEEIPEVFTRCYANEENFLRIERASTLAADRGVSLPQIALAWVFSQQLDVYALVGCIEAVEYQVNAGAIGIELTETEAAWLNLERDDRG